MTAVANEIFIGATAAATVTNIVAAITAGTGVGSKYSTGTVAHATVTATDGAGDTVVAEALTGGVAGNSIAKTESMSLATWDATAVLAGGVAAVLATGSLTLTDVPADTNTCTVGGKVYTWQTVLTNVDGNVFIGANAAACVVNLVAAIMLGTGAGTKYATAMTANTGVTAIDDTGDVVTVSAISLVAATGNAIASTDTMDNATWGAATLTGGVDAVKATGTLTLTGVPVDADTLTLGSTVYTFKSTMTQNIGTCAGTQAALNSAGNAMGVRILKEQNGPVKNAYYVEGGAAYPGRERWVQTTYYSSDAAQAVEILAQLA